MSTSKAAPDSAASGAGLERFIVLLRHGIAEDAAPDQKDEDRALTTEGQQRMKEIARGLTRIFPKLDAIYSSPLRRAVQTAQRVAKAYGGRVEVTVTDALRPGASPKELRALLESSGARRVIAVGHEPNLTHNLRALAHLGRSARVELKKGGCYGVRLTKTGGVLEWVLPPRALRKLQA